MANKAEEVNAFLKQVFPAFRFDIDQAGDKTAKLSYMPQERDLRPGGTVSGPTLFAMADAALYVAILAEIGLQALAVTTNLNLNFVNKPDANQTLIADCKLLKVGKALVVGEVSLISQQTNTLVAHATGTYSIPPKKT